EEVSEKGNVNNLSVKNESNYYLFFMDGDILSGAKQNRVLNTSLLIAPNSIVKIPVSCVERNRWSYKSKNFRSNNFTAPHNMQVYKNRQTTKNLKLKKDYSADQYSIWGEVDKYEKKYNYKSATNDLTLLYDKSHLDIDVFVSQINIDKESNGMAIFVNNKIVSVDIFSRGDVLSEYFHKLIYSVGVEASLLRTNPDNHFNESEIKYKTVEFLDNLETLEYEIYKSIGVGNQKRLISDNVSGFSLEFGNIQIHTSVLNLIGDNNVH